MIGLAVLVPDMWSLGGLFSEDDGLQGEVVINVRCEVCYMLE